MNDDTRGMIYGTLVVFLIFLVSWLGFVYIAACGFTLTCIQGAPLVIRTPIPTLIPREQPAVQMPAGTSPAQAGRCQVGATDLIGAWVEAGHPETEAFSFTDLKGQTCEATFADIQPLFVENSLWFPGSLGCTSCHNAELTDRSGGLDLSTYNAIALGARRAPDSTAAGSDIFGRDSWQDSILHEFLVSHGLTTLGHSPDVEPSNPVLYVGQAVMDVEVTATPTP